MEDDIIASLEASAGEGDPATMALALSAVALAQNMSALARQSGITQEDLYKALAAGGNPSFATIARVARSLGFALTFRPIVAPADEGASGFAEQQAQLKP